MSDADDEQKEEGNYPRTIIKLKPSAPPIDPLTNVDKDDAKQKKEENFPRTVVKR